MQHGHDDSVIIQQVLQGRQAAYAILVERYQQYVFTLVLRFVKDREVAEELAQDVFVKAYRYLADFKGSSKFSTWLYTIASNTCLSHLRKKADGTLLMDEDRMLAVEEMHSTHRPSADLLEQKNTKQMLQKAIGHLTEGDAQVITLFYQAEQSLEEIGIILGITPNNVKVKLFRARQKLKEILETRFPKELIWHNND